MPRKGGCFKREIVADPVFKNTTVSKLINCVMIDGKKGLAQKIVYQAFSKLSEKTSADPVEVFNKALGNVMPLLEVRSKRVGGATYQVPVEVRVDRRLTLGIRWLILFSRKRKGKEMAERLYAEILDAYNNTGAAVKKKEDTHKMAESNKAFSHYKW